MRGESGGATIKCKKQSVQRYFSKNEEETRKEREETLEGWFVKTTT